MKFKILIALALLLSFCSNAQILYSYPKGQDFYEGGRDAFFKEVVFTALNNKLKACDKSEALLMRFVVYPDNSVKYVADNDSTAVANNKCLKDKMLEIVKTMKKFKPAEEDGKKYAAMFFGTFTDDMLRGNYSSREDFAMPVYIHKGKEGGIEKFREKFANCFDTNGFKPVGNEYSFTLNFDVHTNGETGFFHMNNISDLKSFNEMVVKCAANTKKSYWKPGNYKGIPIKQIFKMPVKFSNN